MKTLFTTITLCTVFSAFAAVECQMLLPEKEQKEILSGRRYPQSTKRRLSAAAVKDGYAALDKKDLDSAMREFNRAWRFKPENMVFPLTVMFIWETPGLSSSCPSIARKLAAEGVSVSVSVSVAVLFPQPGRRNAKLYLGGHW